MNESCQTFAFFVCSRSNTAVALNLDSFLSLTHDFNPLYTFEPLLLELLAKRGLPNHRESVSALSVIDAKKNLVTVPLTRGYSFPHRTEGVFGAARVMLRPASEGTGVIAGGSVRAVLEAVGVRNVLTKSQGSRNPHNVIKAVVDGLKQLRSAEETARRRGKELAEIQG